MFAELLWGTRGTIELALFGWLFGFPAGLLLAMFAQYSTELRLIIRIGATGVVVIPALAVLFWLHYPLQAVLGVVWPPTVTTCILLVFYVAMVSGEIVQSEMSRLEKEFIEPALVLGVRQAEFTLRILLLGALENGVPRLLSLAIVSVHMTMFASLIGVEELFRVTQRLNAQFLRPVELYTAMALIYALLCLPLYGLAFLVQRRLEWVRSGD